MDGKLRYNLVYTRLAIKQKEFDAVYLKRNLMKILVVSRSETRNGETMTCWLTHGYICI